jgi:hypothetical protein
MSSFPASLGRSLKGRGKGYLRSASGGGSGGLLVVAFRSRSRPSQRSGRGGNARSRRVGCFGVLSPGEPRRCSGPARTARRHPLPHGRRDALSGRRFTATLPVVPSPLLRFVRVGRRAAVQRSEPGSSTAEDRRSSRKQPRCGLLPKQRVGVGSTGSARKLGVAGRRRAEREGVAPGRRAGAQARSRRAPDTRPATGPHSGQDGASAGWTGD